MAATKLSMAILSSLPLLFLLCLPLFSVAVKTVTIQEICAKHTNPSFCTNFLNPKAGSDLATLGQYTIHDAVVKALDTLTLIHSLISSTKDPALKQRYIACSSDYNDVLLVVENASKELSSGDYNGLIAATNAVDKGIQDCDSKPPGSDPSEVPKDNKDMEDVNLILVIIVGFLTQN